MASAPPTLLLLSAPPDAPGATRLLGRAVRTARAGGRVSVLLSGPGLAWADEPALAELAAIDGVAVGVCSANAREAGWTLDTTPPFIGWKALVSWLRDLGPDQPLWTAL